MLVILLFSWGIGFITQIDRWIFLEIAGEIIGYPLDNKLKDVNSILSMVIQWLSNAYQWLIDADG